MIQEKRFFLCTIFFVLFCCCLLTCFFSWGCSDGLVSCRDISSFFSTIFRFFSDTQQTLRSCKLPSVLLDQFVDGKVFRAVHGPR